MAEAKLTGISFALRTRPGKLRYHHVLDEVALSCLNMVSKHRLTSESLLSLLSTLRLYFDPIVRRFKLFAVLHNLRRQRLSCSYTACASVCTSDKSLHPSLVDL